MRPFSKTMKIANLSKVTEKTALKQLLGNYHDTPHPAIRLSPASIMFRDGQEGNFLRVTASDDAIKDARKRDCQIEERRKVEVNRSKFCKDQQIK